MSNHYNIMEATKNDSTTMTMMNNNNKPKRKSVQFGRVSYSDDSNEKELSQHHPHEETPHKFLERSAMCSSVPIPPPCPPQRKASAEVVLVDGEIDEFLESASSSSISIATSLMASFVSNDSKEEKEEETDDSDNGSVRYISPLITMRKTISPGGAVPTRTRPRLGVSPSQLPPCFPARCL